MPPEGVVVARIPEKKVLFICSVLESLHKRYGQSCMVRNWWTWKTRNSVLALIVKYLLIVATWELQKARCGAKYGKEQYSVRKCINQIAVTLTHLVASQFVNVKLMPNWEYIVYLKISNIISRRRVMVKWCKPSTSFVKLNSDGSYNTDLCGGVGVIRDCEAHLLFVCLLNLGEGTSNWAEVMAL